MMAIFSKFFKSELAGRIAEHPAGDKGFGWDKIFIPAGYSQTIAELSSKDVEAINTKTKPLPAMKEFFDNLGE